MFVPWKCMTFTSKERHGNVCILHHTMHRPKCDVKFCFHVLYYDVSMAQKPLSFTITVHITKLRDLNSGYTVQITSKHAAQNYTCVWF
jgi:hypothetical protein